MWSILACLKGSRSNQLRAELKFLKGDSDIGVMGPQTQGMLAEGRKGKGWILPWGLWGSADFQPL